jgi:hypothetical protein
LSFCLEKPLRFFLNALRDKESFHLSPTRRVNPTLAPARKSGNRFCWSTREEKGIAVWD